MFPREPLDGLRRVLHVKAFVILVKVCEKYFGDLLLVVYDQYFLAVHVRRFVVIGFFRNGKRRMLVVRFRAVVYLNLPGIPERALQPVSFPAPDPDTPCKYR
mgnify:FL=1